MAEITRARIKSIYAEMKGYLISLPDHGAYTVPATTVKNFNSAVAALSEIAGTDYSRFTIPESARPSGHTEYDLDTVKGQIQPIITVLEAEYGFENLPQSPSPAIAIFNQNSTKVEVQVNYTLNQLIEKEEDETAKQKLQELNEELSKDNSNWDTIKNILIWTLDFSKDLFIKILPILIERYLK